MKTEELIGTLIVVMIPLIVSIITLVKPIIKLNTNITALNITMEQLTKNNTDMQGDLKDISEQLVNHETRIYILEKKEN